MCMAVPASVSGRPAARERAAHRPVLAEDPMLALVVFGRTIEVGLQLREHAWSIFGDDEKLEHRTELLRHLVMVIPEVLDAGELRPGADKAAGGELVVPRVDARKAGRE